MKRLFLTLSRWELYNIDKDRTESNDLAAKYPKRVEKMAEEWFHLAENVDRLKGKALSPVKDKTPSLSFRKDTSSGAAAGAQGNQKKRKLKK